MKMQVILILSSSIFFTSPLHAYEKTNHPGYQQDTIANQQHENGAIEQSNPEAYDHPEKVTADFEDFPNLHPLFVHFPVVLLPMAAFFQILGLFVFKREMSWVVLILVVLGFIGGYIAASFVHPHVADLPEHAQKVFDKHDMYATWTLWLSGIAVLLKAGSHFFMKRAVWAEAVAVLVLLASAYTVSVAGHHGSQLVFIEDVGPQGKYLEAEGHSH